MTIHITNIKVSIIDDCLNDDLKCEREPIDDFARRTLVTSVMSKAAFLFSSALQKCNPYLAASRAAG